MSKSELKEQPAGTLRCVECAATSTDGIGSRALLTAGDEEAEDNDEVAVYCPECVAREFGGDEDGDCEALPRRRRLNRRLGFLRWGFGSAPSSSA